MRAKRGGFEAQLRDYLEHDASHAPNVHRVAVVAIGEQALGRSVPPGRYVLGERMLGVDSSARAKVG